MKIKMCFGQFETDARTKHIFLSLLVSFCALLFLLIISPVYAQEPTFNEPRLFDTDVGDTLSLAVGDLDGDGDLDIIVGNEGEQNAVYLNDGAGNFPPSAARLFGSGSDYTSGVAVGDVNADGHLDLLAGNTGQPNDIYLNDGTGKFPISDTFGTGIDDTLAVAVGDVNGDGHLDLAISNKIQNVVYLNDGGGKFPITRPYTRPFGTNFDETMSLAMGDIDGDGHLDLVTGKQGGQNVVYLNDGTANFSNTVPYTRPFGTGSGDTYGIAVGDMDGDGDLDLVAANQGQQNVVYLNDGSAGFSSRDFGPAADYTYGVAVGDMDGDGDLDIVTVNNNQPNGIYLNDGAGNFPSSIAFGTGSDATYSVVVADVDGDGDLDPIVGNRIQQNAVYLNDGAGDFSSTLDLGVKLDSTGSIAVGDVDGDGTLDIVVGNAQQPNVIYLNDGSGAFPNTSAYTRSFGTSSDGIWSVALGDVDGDDSLDIIAGDPSDQNVIYLNDGYGNFTTTAPYTRPFGTGTDVTRDVDTGDMDGDGDLDLVVGNAVQQNVIYLNDGYGYFTTTAPYTRPFGTGSDLTFGVIVGDLDADGDLDLATGNGGWYYHGRPNAVYLNDGAANFSSDNARAFGTGSDKTYQMAVGDVNGDGRLDIIVGNHDQQNVVYVNDGAGNFFMEDARTFGTGSDATRGVAVADMDGDGDLDLVTGNHQGQNAVYLNDGTGQFGWDAPARTFGSGSDWTTDVAVGDMDGDGTSDIVVGNQNQLNVLHLNPIRQSERLANNLPNVVVTRPGSTREADFYSSPEILDTLTIPITYTLFDREGDPVGGLRAFYSPDGGGRWLSAVPTTETITRSLSTGCMTHYADDTVLPIPDEGLIGAALVITEAYEIADLDVWLSITHTWDADLRVELVSPADTTVQLFTTVGEDGDNFDHTTFSDQAETSITDGTAPFTGTYRPEESLAAFNGETTVGKWGLFVYDEGAGETGTLIEWGLRVQTPAASHTFTWDTFASGFFGQSDNVVLRLEAYPSLRPYTNTVPGPFQWPYAAATTFPFRVRGTQVRVLSGTVPISNALVYRLPAGQTHGAELFVDGAGTPYRTDAHGYLQGRGELGIGDRLMALLPITATDTFTLYYTSGVPRAIGVDAHTVTTPGVQTLTVSADSPLVLFDLDLSLEWDAHNDTIYLDQLVFNLQRASEYLYDFTNGQVALGNVNVFQNGDEWVYSHIVVQANNRLRPFAAQGGVVFTDTVDPHHNTVSDTILYIPGQVTMGSTWNRYGNPGQSLGEDWPIILAHELSHYLLFHDDTYIGMDPDGFLIPISTCLGSAMGDLYSGADNTEFIADEEYWQANCADTLAEQTLGRNEWETMQLWYPELITPTAILSGPTTMPFDFTTVTVHDPYTPADTLVDPTFYIDYQGGGGSSSEARAYLDRDEYVVNLGSPFGGQNRVIAHGAKPGDRLCVFDRPRAQFGCETVEIGDDRLAMRLDADWNPIVQISPVNSTTLTIHFSNTVPISFPLYARIFPDLGYGEAPIPLTLVGDVYSDTFHLTYPAMSGNIQVWVDEPFTETDPRREAVVAYSIGGNPGTMRGAGGTMRGAGGTMRGAGGTMRGAGGTMRGAGAPIISPDGQMIFFTENPMDFAVGTFFTIQGMAGLPPLPPGRTLVGQGYNLVASPGVSLPFGSVSIQYLSNDVLVAGASEEDLTLYFWDGASWTALDTVLDTYFNLASAPSQGEGVYALMASVKIPLYGPGWNLFAYSVHTTQPVSEALLSIQGYYTTVYGYEPTDTTDPWKVYDTGVLTYVNDLEVLEFGKGYWINVSQAITLHLASSVSSMAADVTMPLPPATFYGVVLPGSGFAPVPGMEVVAWIDGHLCGQAETMAVGGQVVYAINVLAEGDGEDDRGTAAGCGAPGREVTFVVDSQLVVPRAPWDISRLWEVTLQPGWPVYLPLVVKG